MALSPSACYRLERRVAAFVGERSVLCTGEHVVLMLSGGADSMAMLHLLRAVDAQLGLRLVCAAFHMDYAARGADSDRDRLIVEAACAEADVPLHVERLQQPLEGAGFQERARALRYGHARAYARTLACQVIVTAHNRDDQAETVLYRLAKYASPRGMAGMRPREGGVARPLLGLGADEIRDYCAARGIAYGEDVTNRSTRYARNAIRLEVLPLLERVNPRVAETLAAAAEMAAAETEVLARATAGALSRARREALPAELAALDVRALRGEPAALRALALHEWLRDLMGGDALVERPLVEALLGLVEREDEYGRITLPVTLEAVRGGGLLRVRRRRPPHLCADLALDAVDLAREVEGLAAPFCARRLKIRLVRGPAGGAMVAGLDALPARVTVRHPRRGERFSPSGLGAETTLLRFLASARVPVEQRPMALVLEVDGRVAGVCAVGPGDAMLWRVAQGYRVHESTRWTLCVSEEEA